MDYLFLVIATICASAKAIICKKIGQDNKGVSGVLFQNANIFAIGAIIILICNIGKVKSLLEISTFSLVLAAFFAVFLLFTQITQIYAMAGGLASLSSLIYTCGFLIPIFYNAAFLDESISVYQLLGIGLLIVALTVILPPERNRSFSFLWLTFALASMIGSGTNAVIQKIHQASEFKDELVPFLILSLLLAALLSFIFSFALKSKESAPHKALYQKRGALFLIVLGGVVVGLMNVTNLRLAGRLPAVVHFPTYNICSMLITALAGKLLFGERIGKRKMLGFLLGLLAITIIGLL